MVSLPHPIQPYQMSIRLKNSNNLCLGSHEGQIIAGNYSLKYYIHQFNLNNWKDIVRSIDFLLSLPKPRSSNPIKKQQGLKFTIERTEEHEMISFLLKGDISFLDLKETKKRYLQDSLFYKIATIEDWSDWKEGESYTIENKIRPDLLVHEEVLSPDNTTLLSTGAHVSYIHNKRLHIANLKEKTFSRISPQSVQRGKQKCRDCQCLYLHLSQNRKRRMQSRLAREIELFLQSTFTFDFLPRQ